MVRVCRVVPKEWEKYAPLGNQIPRTRFVVFKTPLNDRLLTKVRKDKRFNVSNLLNMLARRNQRLGLVIDLTDTDRYYDKNDIEGMCIEYEKIGCPGRGFIDDRELVDTFSETVKRYTNYCQDADALIGVHCTHGVNRSGYLICRFLIENLGWSSHEALEAFETARGHPIANGSYVQALHKASMKRREKVPDSGAGYDSDGRQKKKKKKSKRARMDNDEANEMGNFLQQFIGQIEQQAQELETGSGYGSPSVNTGSYVDSPAQVHWAYPPKRQKLAKTEPKVFEEGVDQDGEVCEDDDEYGEGEDQSISKAQKRRQRRARQQHMLQVMRRGNFHEIKEMQEEFLQAKEAAS